MVSWVDPLLIQSYDTTIVSKCVYACSGSFAKETWSSRSFPSIVHSYLLVCMRRYRYQNVTSGGGPYFFEFCGPRWGWVSLERTQILSEIQFTRSFIEFVLKFVDRTNRWVVIWAWCWRGKPLNHGKFPRSIFAPDYFQGFDICCELQSHLFYRCREL